MYQGIRTSGNKFPPRKENSELNSPGHMHYSHCPTENWTQFSFIVNQSPF
jgi:hypothetical protein